ncbi:MAG: hypothetical protein COA82_12720 [Alkaliphilus sp.]|nr:MAG: hypothetical protein COA82_12720 [Alkaliphilus sp.]
MFDYHMHSKFSFDSMTEIEDNIIFAIKKGIKYICFTDHIDYDFDFLGADSIFDIDEYFAGINLLKKKYINTVAIKIGVEFGLQPHIIEKCKRDVEKYSFDFVIASIHAVDKMDLHVTDYYNLISRYFIHRIY